PRHAGDAPFRHDRVAVAWGWTVLKGPGIKTNFLRQLEAARLEVRLWQRKRKLRRRVAGGGKTVRRAARRERPLARSKGTSPPRDGWPSATGASFGRGTAGPTPGWSCATRTSLLAPCTWRAGASARVVMKYSRTAGWHWTARSSTPRCPTASR